MAVERLAFHAEMVALMQGDLTAERAALHEAVIDTLSDREDDGTPRWSREQSSRRCNRSSPPSTVRQSRNADPRI